MSQNPFMEILSLREELVKILQKVYDDWQDPNYGISKTIYQNFIDYIFLSLANKSNLTIKLNGLYDDNPTGVSICHSLGEITIEVPFFSYCEGRSKGKYLKRQDVEFSLMDIVIRERMQKSTDMFF